SAPPVWLYAAWLIAVSLPPLFAYQVVARPQRRKEVRDTLSMLLPAASITLGGLLGTLSFSLDKILVHDRFGSSALAYYSVLVMFPQEFARIFDSSVSLYHKSIFVSASSGR